MMNFDPMAGESRIEHAEQLSKSFHAIGSAHKRVMHDEVRGIKLINHTFLLLIDEFIIDAPDYGFVLFC
jgi:hypothetical protein